MGERQAGSPLVPKSRSGSEKRRKQATPISVRVTDKERAVIVTNADAASLRPSAYLRMLGTGAKRERERRTVLADQKLAAQLLGQVGRIGGNLAQLLKLANRGELVLVEELGRAVDEARAFVAQAAKALKG